MSQGLTLTAGPSLSDEKVAGLGQSLSVMLEGAAVASTSKRARVRSREYDFLIISFYYISTSITCY